MKKPKTPTAAHKRDYAEFRKAVQDQLKTGGLRGTELQLQYLTQRPHMCMENVTHDDMVHIYQSVIKEHKTQLAARSCPVKI